MAEQPQAPVLLKPVPPQIIHEGAAFGPLDLKRFIQSPNEISGSLRFSAELTNGGVFPNGMICTQDGLLSGIPASGTVGTYEILLAAENDSGIPLNTTFPLTIKSRAEFEDPFFLTNLKSEVWDLLGKNLPIPNLSDAFNRPITPVEIYYLLQRFATLTIWDIYNLEPPGEKTLLTLAGCSPHYDIYDRGSCLVGAPKSLFSHERTLEDALQTARVVAQEVYKRGWTIEFAGFNKMVRAAWIELQHLSVKHGKTLEILHYTPSPEDIKVYTFQAQTRGPTV